MLIGLKYNICENKRFRVKGHSDNFITHSNVFTCIYPQTAFDIHERWDSSYFSTFSGCVLGVNPFMSLDAMYV